MASAPISWGGGEVPVEEIMMVNGSNPTKWVLDARPMTVGGPDPLRFSRDFAPKVAVGHLQGLRLPMADRLNMGEVSLMEAVQQRPFTPPGPGDMTVPEIIGANERADYQGGYVSEQDVAIAGTEPVPGEGPIRDVATSVAYFRSVQTDRSARS